MQGEAWVALGAAGAAAFAAVGTTAAAYFSSRAQSRSIEAKVDTAAEKASAAVENTKSVSNGFADRTTVGIDEVKALLGEVRASQQQLMAISGRTVKRLDLVIGRQDQADARFTEHLSDHLRSMREEGHGG